MGRQRTSRRKTSKNKAYKKGHSTKRRRKDIDQIQDELRDEIETGKKVEFEIDEDLPGMGQHYCIHCAKHFIDNHTLEAHNRTKDHKRRLKDLAQEQYTQEEADRGAGRTKEILPLAHPN